MYKSSLIIYLYTLMNRDSGWYHIDILLSKMCLATNIHYVTDIYSKPIIHKPNR